MRRKETRPKKPDEKKEDVVKIGFDSVNEVVLIAAVVADERARNKYLQHIPADYFSGSGHGEMWTGLQELYRRGLTYSPQTLREIVGEAFDSRTLDDYVRTHPECPPNIGFHVEKLRWHKARRDAAIGPVSEFLELFRDTTSDPSAVQQSAQKLYESLKGHGDLRYLRSSEALVQEHAIELRTRREGKLINTYGLPGLDFYGSEDWSEPKRPGEKRQPLKDRARLIPGAAPGDVTVVVGRSGNGKTTALAQMIRSMIDPPDGKAPRRVLWGAWEQGDRESLELVSAMNLGFNLSDLRTGLYSDEQANELLEEMRRLGSRLRMFDLPFGRDASSERRFNRDNLNLIHQYVGESGCQVFVADLFHMSLEQDDPTDEKKALYRMKAIAKDTKSHIFLVHQLRKDVETRGDPRPTRESISGAGAWIDAADTVLAFHRPGLYAGDDLTLECHILKQREGAWPLAVVFDWDGEYGLIENGRTLPLTKMNEGGAMEEFMGDQGRPRQKRFRR